MSFSSKTKKSNGNPAQKQPESFFQAKLNVGQPGDKYELEADQMAEQVVGEMNEESSVSTANHQVQTQQEEEVQTKEFSDTEVQEKSLADTITPVIQTKVEEEQVQEKEEDEELQKQEEEEVQMNSVAGVDEDDDSRGSLQAKSDQKSTVSPQLESQIKSGTGGSAMDRNTKSSMESGFGADFSDVKVHTDSSAVQMSKDLGAQAFTHGNDIYFNEGKYDPGSSAGQGLLAHELTHTIQQGSSSAVQGKMVQKEGKETNHPVSPPNGVTPINESSGEISFREGSLTTVFRQDSEIAMPMLSLPSFKIRNSNLITVPFEISGEQRVETRDELQAETDKQRDIWKNFILEQSRRHLNEKISEARMNGGFSRSQSPEDTLYFFKGKTNNEFRVFGTESQLLEVVMIPTWDESEQPTSFQVDHVFETQLGGQNRVSNYELLESSANGSSGSKIMWQMNNRLKRVYDVLESDYYQNDSRVFKPNLPGRPARPNGYVNLFAFNSDYNVRHLATEFTLPTDSGFPDRFWSFGQISRKEHLNKIESLTGDEMRQEMGTEDDPALFISPTGGNRINIPTGDQYPAPLFPRAKILERPDFQNLTMLVDAYRANEDSNGVSSSYPNMTWYLQKLPETYTFYVDKQRTIDSALSGTGGVFSSLRLPGMSPIRINTLELTENGFLGIGKVLPTVPLIENADIDIVIDAGSIRLRKLFTAQEFDFPSPFEIDQATLEVSFGTSGLGIEGQVNFSIDQVGEGHIGAAASTEGGFELEGVFNFDSELFDPAEINVEYKDNIWTIGGQIGIPEGKVKGVKSATINATYSENNFSATGEAELDIPGIERGSMSVQYGEEGFSIAGNFDLSSDIPGISGGNVEARVSKAPGDEEYSVFVSGTAQPSIPGINSSLTVTYENGALTLEGRASYERGMLSGTIEVGATNRAIGEDGEPSGEPDDTIRVYGGGSLTLQLTPWLAATAEVRFTPDGEIEVTARLSAESYEVFSRREFNRNLFTVPTIEIPLFAIPLGPRSIGLVAQIGGGLDFTAGFGPGELRNMSAEITYNPEHEEETTVNGHGEFAIPADAGLTLRGDLSLGVSVGIASLTGGIELAGELGLEGEAAAEVDVNWSPQTGLTLDAEGRITVNPKFTFELNAFARASLGIGWFSISETWRHNLASYEWGPDIQFGIVFPVNYREGEPFDMSFDDIRVIYPDLDVINMAKGLARDVKNDLFD